MKLRNKKTGEIINAMFYAPIGKYGIITIWRDTDYLEPSCDRHLVGDYKTLAELNEEWEDYTPAEPLIKDEKIRKAVRAWAESLGVDKVFVEKPSFEHNRFILSVSGYYGIGFDIDIPENIKPCKSYTIAELCGEEEG